MWRKTGEGRKRVAVKEITFIEAFAHNCELHTVKGGIEVKTGISELEKQVEPLEKQAEKAKVYLKKKEDLKNLDVNVFLLENDRLREQLAGVGEKYEIASRDLQETTEKYEHIKEEYDQIQTEIEELDKRIEQARSS